MATLVSRSEAIAFEGRRLRAVVFPGSRLQVLKGFLVFAVIIGMMILWMLFAEHPQRVTAWVLGVPGLVCMGVLLVMYVRRLRQGYPRVALSPLGIHLGYGPRRFVAWDDIEALGVAELHRNKFVIVRTRDTGVPLSRQELANLALFGGQIGIDASHIGADPSDLAGLIDRFRLDPRERARMGMDPGTG
jgi:hypothetical protein